MTSHRNRTDSVGVTWRKWSNGGYIMEAIRCPKCNRLLGYFEGTGTVACPRCRKDTIVCFDTEKKIVQIRATRAPQPE